MQPIDQREVIQVKYVDSDDKYIDKPAVKRDLIVQERFKTKSVDVPGDVYYKQDVIRNTVNTEEVKINYQDGETVYETKEAISKPKKTSKSRKVVTNDVEYEVED